MDALVGPWYSSAMIGLTDRDSPMGFPARQVFGIAELLWMIRCWRWKQHAREWEVVDGKVVGREFLRFSSNGGWFSLFYTYNFSGQIHSGELRKSMMSRKTSKAETDPDTVEFSKRFPDKLPIRVRVDPEKPSRSVVDFSV
jgi:hypothetical protein